MGDGEGLVAYGWPQDRRRSAAPRLVGGGHSPRESEPSMLGWLRALLECFPCTSRGLGVAAPAFPQHLLYTRPARIRPPGAGLLRKPRHSGVKLPRVTWPDCLRLRARGSLLGRPFLPSFVSLRAGPELAMDSASRMLGHRRGRRVTWPFSRLFFFFWRCWDLNSGPSPSATPPALCVTFF
jgi:hypothetical protein